MSHAVFVTYVHTHKQMLRMLTHNYRLLNFYIAFAYNNGIYIQTRSVEEFQVFLVNNW